MVSPCASSSRKTLQSAHFGTRFALAIKTRGARECVFHTATGLPLCTISVSSCFNRRRARTIASKASHERAARPLPPYTTRSSGRSATCGSRLFISIRNAASCGQPKQEISTPRGARTDRGPATTFIASGILGNGGKPCHPSTPLRMTRGRNDKVNGLRINIHGTLVADFAHISFARRWIDLLPTGHFGRDDWRDHGARCKQYRGADRRRARHRVESFANRHRNDRCVGPLLDVVAGSRHLHDRSLENGL